MTTRRTPTAQSSGTFDFENATSSLCSLDISKLQNQKFKLEYFKTGLKRNVTFGKFIQHEHAAERFIKLAEQMDQRPNNTNEESDSEQDDNDDASNKVSLKSWNATNNRQLRLSGATLESS
jgi:hypothetical protein